MSIPIHGSARIKISAKELRALGPSLEQLHQNGTVVLDTRRRRPLYFDGRFLAARDLIREQAYYLTRQSDLAGTSNPGIVKGLMVRHDESGGFGRTIQIARGLGVTPSGKPIILNHTTKVDLATVPAIEQLNTDFDDQQQLRRERRPYRSGLFIVALRPVEYSTSPITSYPTTPRGHKSKHDGEIVESASVVLVPYDNSPSNHDLATRRAETAREIFLQEGLKSLPVGVLPLAMVALELDQVRWLDPFLVRRRIATEPIDLVGLGLVQRSEREAHFYHYDRYLHEVIASHKSHLTAADHFRALPACGRLPAGAINPIDFTQTFFPSEMDVEMSIIPEDELANLLEESLALPPIDLMLPSEAQQSTSVLVLAPLSQEQIHQFGQSLTSTKRRFRIAAPGLLAKSTPMERLKWLKLPEPTATDPTLSNLNQSPWQKVFSSTKTAKSGAPLLWYIRRPNIDVKAKVSISQIPDTFTKTPTKTPATNQPTAALGPHVIAKAGESVLIDGSRSRAATGRKIVRYLWTWEQDK